MKTENCILIPAAGASTRLGRPKQLVLFEGESLIRRAVRFSLAVCDNVVVVLGSGADDIGREIAELPVEITINKNWEHGIGSSISQGITFAGSTFSELKGVLIHLCDLPHVTSSELGKLFEASQSNDGKIVFSIYEDIEGVPAYFPSSYFSELSRLEGDSGAQSIMKSAEPEAKTGVNLGLKYFDVDLPEDCEKLLKSQT